MSRKRKGTSSISIKDVAQLAGVSIATVSRVINKVPSVKEENRKKVFEAIQRLKFRPSVSAQRLASGKSNVIALVIPRYEGIFYSFYALELIRGVGTICDALKLDLLLHLADSHSILDFSGVGGVIFADIIGNRHQVEDVLERKIPSIVINNYVEDLKISCIAIDNFKGAQLAVEYLISLGHRRIAHITGDLITQAAVQRLEGYKATLKNKGIALDDNYIVKTDYSRGQAREATEKLLSLQLPPTAIFVASDSMALEVMAVAIEKGFKIPSDLSIVGFDDNPSGLYAPVALTTVRQPLIKMGEEAVKYLDLIMKGKQPTIKKTLLSPELVIRESCSQIKVS
ncbi:MAG: LacI family transcriptional regulator [Candidatus Omnitrophica bacterium]|nr:LacI family transcriptional regulator [Candidatus Omnitrophota bacterium]